MDCTFNSTISYTVVIKDQKNGTVNERNVSSDNCESGTCSFDFADSDRSCYVSVMARNKFGLSSFTEVERNNITGEILACWIVWIHNASIISSMHVTNKDLQIFPHAFGPFFRHHQLCINIIKLRKTCI